MRIKNSDIKIKEGVKLFLVKEDITVKDAMKKMDEVAEKILFVVNEEMKLSGSLTDGDIRRWILSDGNLGEKIEKIFNRDPVYVKEDYRIEDVKKTMIDQKIGWIPVIDETRKVSEILLWGGVFGENEKMKAKDLGLPVVIMGGGQGRRLDPFTRILPKPLIPIGEKTVAEIIMDNFINYGCDDFYMIVGYKAEMIKSYFNGMPGSYGISFIQEDSPRGTIGGLKLLPENFSENFFVSNCDIIINTNHEEIYNFHVKNKYDITIVGSMQHFRIPYGVMRISNGGNLDEIREKPEHDFLVNTGMYIFRRKVIDLLPDKGIFHATDLINKIKDEGGKIGVYPVTEKTWIDIGQWEEYKKSVEKLRLFK